MAQAQEITVSIGDADFPLDRTQDPEHWAIETLPADSPRFMLPIPQNEMLYNKALTAADQNEYWRK